MMAGGTDARAMIARRRTSPDTDGEGNGSPPFKLRSTEEASGSARVLGLRRRRVSGLGGLRHGVRAVLVGGSGRRAMGNLYVFLRTVADRGGKHWTWVPF